MKTSSIIALGIKYKPSLQNDHGRRVLSVLVLVLALGMFAIGSAAAIYFHVML